jgi:hypothetical protein
MGTQHTKTIMFGLDETIDWLFVIYNNYMCHFFEMDKYVELHNL